MNRITFAAEVHGQVRRLARTWRFMADSPPGLPLERPSLAQLARLDPNELPRAVQESPLAQRYLALFGEINWDAFPEREQDRAWSGPDPQSPVPWIIALLMRLDQGHRSMGQLVDFLHLHPELTWIAGFPLIPCATSAWGFDPVRSVPTAESFSRTLRNLSNSWLQFLLDETVTQIRSCLPAEVAFGQVVSTDTKHILAWVKENNPKAFIKGGRFHKDQQPAGDPDCRVGCKRRTNQRNEEPSVETPAGEGQPATGIGSGIGEFYWGYASGIVVTKVDEWGEFVLAELTQTFDKSDISYFFPLMEQVEGRLGFAPPNGTADAAYDAFYIYEYFHKAGGMAAIPSVIRGKPNYIGFNEEGTPLCAAGLPMFCKGTFTNRSTLVEHDRERWWCPLLHPEPTADQCPANHATWHKDGCKSTIPASIGARQRHQIDRDSDQYKQIYRQRTASERIFSQAVALGIERPKLRNIRSITNWNTLIYIIINLRALQRIRQKQQD